MKITKHNFSIPCVSIDDFIPSTSLLRASSEGFNDVSFDDWVTYNKEDHNQIQYCTKLTTKIPHATQLILDHITTNLNPDAIFDLNTKSFPDISHYGGGLMITPNSKNEGGYLGMHVDAAIHGKHDNWKREYSAVLCVSEEYDSSFDLLLHDGQDHIRLPYKFNRLNIFKCGENSWHGFPEISKGLDRKALGVMYWSKLSEQDKAKTFVKAQFNNNLLF
jgi:hypothetical protein